MLRLRRLSRYGAPRGHNSYRCTHVRTRSIFFTQQCRSSQYVCKSSLLLKTTDHAPPRPPRPTPCFGLRPLAHTPRTGAPRPPSRHTPHAPSPRPRQRPRRETVAESETRERSPSIYTYSKFKRAVTTIYILVPFAHGHGCAHHTLHRFKRASGVEVCRHVHTVS